MSAARGGRTDAERALRLLAVDSFAEFHNDKSLVPRATEFVRAGIQGGLPFDSLTTDVVGGCLPSTHICYGNCFAARAAFEAGVAFGTRTPNVLDNELLDKDLAELPSSQAYLRNGWNSDPSWAWEIALGLAERAVAWDRHIVFITKCFRRPSEDTMKRLVQLKAEMRVSVSAFDTSSQLTIRRNFIESYREFGGVAIPTILSAWFIADELNAKQSEIVAYFLEADFPVAENSLRFAPASPMMDAIDLAHCGLVSSTGDYWSGLLFEELKVPTLTSVPPGYRGLDSGFLSHNEPSALAELWLDPVRAHREVMSGERHDKPRMCGVPAKQRL
jgi:hypothetical protein